MNFSLLLGWGLVRGRQEVWKRSQRSITASYLAFQPTVFFQLHLYTHTHKHTKIMSMFNPWASLIFFIIDQPISGLPPLLLKNEAIRTSLVVQCLRLCVPNAGGPGSIPNQGTRSHMPQQRPMQPNKYFENKAFFRSAKVSYHFVRLCSSFWFVSSAPPLPFPVFYYSRGDLSSGSFDYCVFNPPCLAETLIQFNCQIIFYLTALL